MFPENICCLTYKWGTVRDTKLRTVQKFGVRSGKEPNEFDSDFPAVIDGARGVCFTNRAVDLGEKEEWVDFGFDAEVYK